MSDSSSLGHRAVFLHAIPGTDSQFPSIKEALAKNVWHIVVKVRQAWDLGHCSSTAMLAPGHSSPEQQNTQKLYGTKNNCERAPLGQILDQKDKKKKKKIQLPFLRSQEQKWSVGSKCRVLCMPPGVQHHKETGEQTT